MTNQLKTSIVFPLVLIFVGTHAQPWTQPCFHLLYRKLDGWLLWFHFCCYGYIYISWPKPTWRMWGLDWLTIPSCTKKPGKPIKAGTPALVTSQPQSRAESEACALAAYSLLLHSASFLHSLTAHVPAHDMVLPTSMVEPPTSINNQDNSHTDMPTGQPYLNSSSIETLAS